MHQSALLFSALFIAVVGLVILALEHDRDESEEQGSD